MDAFYTFVEEQDNPKLKEGTPQSSYGNKEKNL